MTDYISQGIDYLGFLEAKLRDLQGYATFAYELIQNADDAQADKMVFDVCDQALIVENTSLFSDCGHVEKDECPWKESRGHLCDFHRFRQVSGGDKRNQAGTTGAFGIGFISVYQITDRPALQSGKRHWIIRPDEPENQRIKPVPVIEEYDGTRFILPWALDQHTRLRQRLRTQAITMPETAETLTTILDRHLPDAILFLKHINRIELRRNGALVKIVQRTCDGDKVVVQNGDTLQLWYLLTSSFTVPAQQLRARYHDQIEQKRTAHVTVAIPDRIVNHYGRFYACLPTEQSTELPVHINADFYPSTDRKRILLTDDYQGAWNRAAITEAAKRLASAIPLLPQLLGHKALWELFERLKKVADEAATGRQDQVFQEFWRCAQEQIEAHPTVFIWPEGWQKPAETFLLEQPEDEEALHLWQEMGLAIVHPDLRPYFPLLRSVNVRVLGLADLVQALKQAGLDRAIKLEQAPAWLQSRDNRYALGRAIERLSKQRGKGDVLKTALHDLRQCAIALTRRKRLRKPTFVFNPSNDNDLATLFMELGQADVLLDPDNPPAIAQLAEQVTPERVLDKLENIKPPTFTQIWREKPSVIFGIVDWFANYRQQLRTNESLRQRLSKLPIWPSGNDLFPLDELYITGDFEDPLGLATILHAEMQRNRRDFLRDAGVKELTLKNYAANLVPKTLQHSQHIDHNARRRLIWLFASELSKLRELAIQQALAACPLVECQDGSFRPARGVYFATEAVLTILDHPPLAQLPSEHAEVVRDLYRWLGVAEEPSFADIVKRIDLIVAGSPTNDNCRAIEHIFRHLSQRQITPPDPALQNLQHKRWLPSRKDRSCWFKPSELYAVYQDYLFESQANFLGFDRSLQNQARDFLQSLGVNLIPTLKHVIDHLKWAIQEGQPVHYEVYRFLNDHARDPAIRQLRDSPCLWLENEKKYVKPVTVFWSSHPYKRYRYQLPVALRAFGQLLETLGVRQQPTHGDALLVLQEIADLFKNRDPIDQETYDVVQACWRQLNQALEQNLIDLQTFDTLRQLPVIPTEGRILRVPVAVFLEDRPDLAEQFNDFKGKWTILRIFGCWQAMAASGVRLLSEAVEVNIIDQPSSEPDPELTKHLRSLHKPILRVLEAMRASSQPAYDITSLRRLRVERVEQLRIQYTLPSDTKVLKSRPVSADAYLDRKQTIIYLKQSPSIPWPALARAIAEALAPQKDPPSLASTLMHVLSASSLDEAEATLDQLGFARLVVDPDEEGSNSQGEAPEETGNPPIQPSNGNNPIAPAAPENHTGSGTNSRQQPPAQTPPTPSPPSGGRLRTYVEPTSNSPHAPTSQRQNEINEIDRAGIKRVLQFERARGRDPRELSHHTAGYDIESRDKSGNVVRYIEVKSLAGPWDGRGVALSAAQFNTGRRYNNQYWLYVVERATSADARIYRIQNPAGRVDQFFYDNEWRALAERDEG